VVAGVWLWQRGRQAAPSLLRRPVIRWWLPLLALTTLSALAHGASKSELWGLTGAFLYFAVFALALDLFERDASARRHVLVAAALTAGAVAGLGVVERLVFPGTPFYFKDGVMAAQYSFGSTIGHTNFLAAYLALVLGPLAAVICLCAMRQRAPLRPWLITSGAVMVLTLVLARSIGALAGIATGALLVLVIGLLWARSRVIKVALVVVAILAVAVAVGIGASKLRSSNASITVRAAALRIGLAAVQERPWLGFGNNGFAHESARLERALFGRELLELRPANQPFSAHDAYMNVAVERGLGALIAFLALLSVIVISGLRRSTKGNDVDRDVLMVGLLAGVVAFAAQAMTENLFSYSKVTTIFWIMAAALVSLGGRTDEPQAR
jgi:O-antigen ligase